MNSCCYSEKFRQYLGRHNSGEKRKRKNGKESKLNQNSTFRLKKYLMITEVFNIPFSIVGGGEDGKSRICDVPSKAFERKMI